MQARNASPAFTIDAASEPQAKFPAIPGATRPEPKENVARPILARLSPSACNPGARADHQYAVAVRRAAHPHRITAGLMLVPHGGLMLAVGPATRA